ncbi:hypothetical protein [Paeniglutamicibacter sp.]|uniref:hypothetical protein n=1 Tax=Paeniglutamicibacter sp. TaxID=1934391 RepID=UPI00398A31F3
MKIVINGKKYPLAESLQRATLNDLYALKLQTGMGMKSLRETLQRMKDYEDQADFLEEAENMQAFRGMIWLCRRAAGEFLTVEEANNDPLVEIGFENDEEAPVAETDPKAQAGSAPDVEPVPAA